MYIRKVFAVYVCVYNMYEMQYNVLCVRMCSLMLAFMKAYLYVCSHSRMVRRSCRSGDVALQLEILEQIFRRQINLFGSAPSNLYVG